MFAFEFLRLTGSVRRCLTFKFQLLNAKEQPHHFYQALRFQAVLECMAMTMHMKKYAGKKRMIKYAGKRQKTYIGQES